MNELNILLVLGFAIALAFIILLTMPWITFLMDKYLLWCERTMKEWK
jgi:hypothetical protein